MGATVQLLNKYHQAIAKATSDIDGHFAFALASGRPLLASGFAGQFPAGFARADCGQGAA